VLRAAAFFQSEGPDAVFMRLQGEMLAGHTVVAWVLRRQMSGVDVLKKKGGLQAALSWSGYNAALAAAMAAS
jgi:hypothetical protein